MLLSNEISHSHATPSEFLSLIMQNFSWHIYLWLFNSIPSNKWKSVPHSIRIFQCVHTFNHSHETWMYKSHTRTHNEFGVDESNLQCEVQLVIGQQHRKVNWRIKDTGQRTRKLDNDYSLGVYHAVCHTTWINGCESGLRFSFHIVLDHNVCLFVVNKNIVICFNFHGCRYLQ